jgi:hypothetical protein
LPRNKVNNNRLSMDITSISSELNNNFASTQSAGLAIE